MVRNSMWWEGVSLNSKTWCPCGLLLLLMTWCVHTCAHTQAKFSVNASIMQTVVGSNSVTLFTPAATKHASRTVAWHHPDLQTAVRPELCSSYLSTVVKMMQTSLTRHMHLNIWTVFFSCTSLTFLFDTTTFEFFLHQLQMYKLIRWIAGLS